MLSHKQRVCHALYFAKNFSITDHLTCGEIPPPPQVCCIVSPLDVPGKLSISLLTSKLEDAKCSHCIDLSRNMPSHDSHEYITYLCG